MKRNLLIGIVSIMLMLTGTIGTIGAVNKSYELVSDALTTEVAVDDDLNYNDMYIIVSNMYGSKKVDVTRDMIVYGYDTSTAGSKSLMISYDNQQFSVGYVVKYRIKFMVGNEVINTQMVNNRAELVVPEDPKLAGNEFLGWIPEVPEVLSGNIVFEANFTDKPKEIPTLKPLVATYGDKLSSIQLPSNQYGSWEFVDELTTTVGNAGVNKFKVVFNPTNTELSKIESEVTITVDKKELEFKNLVTEFAYDGNIHKPTFDLDVDVKVEYFGPSPIEIGSYVFTLEIVDDNYKGYLAGSFEITKPVVTITVHDVTINLGDSIPEIEYTVEGLDDPSELGIRVIKPNVVHAGEYVLSVSWTNNNYKVKVIEGKLTVNKVEMEVLDPSYITDAVYGEKLSTVVFDNINPNGTWTWKNPDDVILTPTNYKAIAVFTPNELSDYDVIERELTIKVQKKELSVIVLEQVYDYDGTPKNIKVQIEDGTYTDVEIVISYQDETITTHPVNAGNYYCIAKINDDRYKGEFGGYLTINKINPTLPEGEKFFNTVYNVNWNTYLSDIKLDKGYSFTDPLSITYLDENGNPVEWKDATDRLTIVKELKVAAIYTPEDQVNYNTLNGEFTVVVNKLQGQIKGVAQSYTKTYNGEAHTLDTIYAENGNEIDLVFKYELITDEVNGTTEVKESLLNAGTYKVTITLPESDHYLGAEATTTVTILKSDIALPGDYTATFEDTLGSLKLPDSEYGNWTWKEGNDTLVGLATSEANYHVAVFTPTNPNYNAVEHTVNVTVVKKQLYITVSDSEFNGSEYCVNFTYDGSGHKVSYTITDANNIPYSINDITVSNSDKEMTDSGKYSFVLEVKEDNYFSAQVLVSVSVNKKVIAKPEKDNTVYTYNATEQTYNIQSNEYYTVENNKKTNAGNYVVYVSLNNNNYIWDDETTSRLTYDFVIEKAKFNIELPQGLTATYTDTLSNVTLPDTTTGTWKWDNNTLSVGATGVKTFAATYYVTEEEGMDNYIDSTYELTVTVNKKTVINPNGFSDRVYTGLNNKPYVNVPEEYKDIYTATLPQEDTINVNTYYVTYTLTDPANYKWETTDEAEFKNPYNIVKAQSSITELTIEDWTYGNSPKAPSIIGKFVESVEYTYSKDGINFYPFEDMEFTAGKYTLKAIVADTNNYNGVVGTIEFEVAKKNVVLPTITNVVYDGLHHTSGVVDTDVYTVAEDNGGVEAGDYNVVLQLKDTTNYKWVSSDEATYTLVFKITPSTVNNWSEHPSVLEQYTYSQFTSIGSASANYGNVIIEYKLQSEEDDAYTTTMPTNAGKYVIRFRVEETTSYNGIHSVEKAFEIVKYQVEKPNADETTFVYDGTLKTYNITLSDYYTVSGNKETNANEAGYTVTVALKDTNNYEWNDGTIGNVTFTFIIEKQTVTAPSDKVVEYTGEEFNDDILENQLYTFESVKMTEVGTVYIPVTLVDSDNYKWDCTNEDTYKVKFQITKAQAEITDFEVTNVTYGDDLTPSANTTFGTVVFKYSNNKNGEYSNTKPTTAGTYYVKAIVEGNNNFDGFETEAIQVKINPIKVIKPAIDNTVYVYTGEEQTYNLVESLEYTISNKTHTNANKYAVVVTLNDTTNYCWDDLSTQALSYTFEIKQATNEWTTEASMSGWTYGDQGTLGTATSKFGTVVVEYKPVDGAYSKNLPTQAGNYVAKFSVKGNDNYTALEETIEFEIAKKVVVEPTIDSKEYTGSTLTADISNTTVYTVKTNNGGTNVGEYDVILTLVDSTNYKWSDVNTADKTFKFAITKAQAEISDLTISGWAYLEEAKSPVANTTFGTITYTYVINGVESINAPTLPGTYTVIAKVEDTFNFDGDTLETTVTITKAIVTVPTVTSKAYTGETQTSGLTTNELYSVVDEGGIDKGQYTATLTLIKPELYMWSTDEEALTVEVKYNIVAEENVWKTNPSVSSSITYGEALTVEAEAKFGDVVIEYKLTSAADNTYTKTIPTEAGNYTVRFSVAADSHGSYGALLETLIFVINKKQIAIPSVDNTIYTYNGLEQTYNIANNDNYTINGNVQTEANENGYTVTVQLKDTNNYEWNDGTINDQTYTFVIKKGDYTPNGTVSATATYGQKLSEISINYTSNDGTWVWKTDSSLVGNAGDNYHLAVFTPESTNYNPQEISVLVNVLQATNNFTVELEMSGWTYNEASQEPSATAAFGTVQYKYYKGEELLLAKPTNAGTYSVVAYVADSSDNYTDIESSKVTFTIEKADPVVEWPTDIKAPWGTNLSEIDTLPEGFSWVTNQTLPKTIGTYSYQMKYTPNDTDNYNILQKYISVEITKKAVEITNINLVFDYIVNNAGFDLGITHTNDDNTAELLVSYLYSQTEGGSFEAYDGQIINAGYYKVIISMASTTYYEALEEVEYLVVVNKAKEQIFDETTTEFGETVSSITPESEYGTWSIEVAEQISMFSTDVVLSTIGKIEAIATFTPSAEWIANFEIITKTVYINVEARTLTIEITNNEFVYNTTTQYLQYKIYDKGVEINPVDYDIEIIGNNGLINVGSETFTLSIANTIYFRGSVTSTLTIKKALVSIPQVEGKTYNKTLQTASVVDTALYTVTENNGGIEAGVYDLVLTLTDHDNYKWDLFDHYNDPESVTLGFIIEKATIDMSGVVWNYQTPFTYTGSAHTVSLTNLPQEITKVNYIGNTYTDVDDYTTTASFEYDTTNYNVVSNQTLNWSIAKATPIISDFVLEGWTYGEEASVASATTDFGTIVFTYSQAIDGQYLSTIPTSAGTYYVKASVQETKNWEANEQVISFEISKCDVEVVWTTLAKYIYTGSTFVTPTAKILNVGGKTEALLTVTEANSKTFKNAGSYKFNASTTDEDLLNNYNFINSSIDVEVEKKQLEFSPVATYNSTWTSGLLLSAITLETIEVENVVLTPTWKTPTVELNVGANQEFVVIYTPEDTLNYEITEVTVKVTIQKASTIISCEDSYTYSFNGEAHNFVASINHYESEIEYTYKLNGETIDKILGVGTYTVIINVDESTHYEKATKQITVTVTKGTIEYTKPQFSVECNQSLNDILLPSTLGGKTGTFKWIDKGIEVSDLNLEVFTKGEENTQYTLVFTPDDENYNEVIISNVLIVVNRLETTVSFVGGVAPTLTYNGSQIDANTMATWFTTNSNGTLTATCSSTMQDANTYTINVKVNETDTYTGYDSTFNVTINKANYTPEIPTVNATYGQTLSEVLPTSNNGTWSWVMDGATLVGNVGENTFEAKFEPKNANYKADQESYTITINVAKGTPIISNFTVSEKEYTYEASSNAKATTNIGEIVFMYSTTEDGVYTLTIPEVVGTYWVKATVNESDYWYAAETEAKSYNIVKATPNVTWPEYTGTYYEDRVNPENDKTNSPSALHAGSSNVILEGTFTYGEAVYGKATVTVTFTPDDQMNYRICSKEVNITIAPVAQNTNGTMYGTVEKALAANITSGDVVSIIPGTDPIIKSNVIIASGVTLFVPYSTDCTQLGDSGTAYIFNGSGNGDAAAPTGNLTSDYSYLYGHVFSTDTKDPAGSLIERDSLLKSTVTINSGVKVTNNGTIEVAGQLSGGHGGSYAAGQTAGLYARIVMKASSQIINNGTIYCYGYIDEDTLDNGSKLYISNTGTLYQPYVLRDFRGGTVMSGLYDTIDQHSIVAYNSFEYRNVSSLVHVVYGGKIYGWANLYAGDQQNKTTIASVGTSNSIINLTNETYSYLLSKYNPYTEVNKMDIYGGASTSTMKLSINIKLLGKINVSTDKVYFPFTWRYNVTLHKADGQPTNAVYEMNQKFKLMNGAVLKVEKGAELSISEINVYESYTDKISHVADGTPMAYGYHEGGSYTLTPHNLSTQPAKLIVNGKLTVGKLGGAVYSEEEGAELYITNSASLSTKEAGIVVREGLAIYASVKTFQTIDGYAKLYLYKNGNVDNDFSFIGVGNYVSKSVGSGENKKTGWFSKNIKINYDANGGTLEDSQYQGPYEIGPEGYTIESITAATPTRDHYTFGGWYIDPECTIPAVGQTIYSSVSVFAKWNPITYNIIYSDVFDESVTDASGETITNAHTTFNATTNTSFLVGDAKPTHGNLVFGGFYLDSECSEDNKLAMLDGGYLTKEASDILLTNGEITIYMKWYIEGTETYTINYNNPKNSIHPTSANFNAYAICPTTVTFVAVGGEITEKLPSFTKVDEDIKYQDYFVNWVDELGNVVTEIKPGLFTVNENGEKVCTLTAVWATKAKITIKEAHASGDFNVEISSFWYKPNTDYVIPEFSSRVGENGYYFSTVVMSTTDANTTTSVGAKIQFTSDTTVTGTYLKIVKVTINAPGKYFFVGNYDLNVNIKSGFYSDNATSFTATSNKTYTATGNSGKSFYIVEGSTFTTSIDHGASVSVTGAVSGTSYTVGTSNIIVSKK